MVQTTSVIGKALTSPKLIFRRHDNHYFFAEAWVDGENSGWQVSKSRAERTAERELAGMVKTEALALRNR
jgi:hypothetical protein